MHSKEESRINIRDQKESKGAEDAFDDFISEIYMALGKKKKESLSLNMYQYKQSKLNNKEKTRLK